MDDSRREIELVLLSQAGDRGAQDMLLRSVQVGLRGYLRGLLGRDDLADDVLQDVFVLTIRKLRWLRDPALFRPWIHRLTTREAFRVLRRETRRRGRSWDEVEPDMAVAGDSPAADAVAAEWKARIPELLDGVSPKSRAVLLLHYTQGLRLDETAAVLGLSLGTIKSRLAYGLKLLRERLSVEPREKGTHE